MFPADPLFPNDATAYEVGKTDDLTGADLACLHDQLDA